MFMCGLGWKSDAGTGMKGNTRIRCVTRRSRNNWVGNASVVNKEKNVREHFGEGM